MTTLIDQVQPAVTTLVREGYAASEVRRWPVTVVVAESNEVILRHNRERAGRLSDMHLALVAAWCGEEAHETLVERLEWLQPMPDGVDDFDAQLKSLEEAGILIIEEAPS